MTKPLSPVVATAAALLLGLPPLVCPAQTTSNTVVTSPSQTTSNTVVTSPTQTTSAAVTATGGAPVDPGTPVSSTVTPYNVTRTRRLVRVVDSNTDNVKAQGDFGAQLWLVEGRQFFEDWRKPETPSINPVEIVPRGRTINTVVIFYGLGRDAGGLANAGYAITVKRPDGSIYSQRNDAIGWQTLAPADPKQLLLGQDSMGVTIGPDDPAGLYTVEVNVRDKNTRVELPLRASFVVQ